MIASSASKYRPLLLAGLALGFVLGKLLAGRPRPVSEELE